MYLYVHCSRPIDESHFDSDKIIRLFLKQMKEISIRSLGGVKPPGPSACMFKKINC